MTYLFIGSIIGIVMGLTGSGGALVAIPLFMSLAHANLKEASVLSLLAVIIASVINFLPQKKFSDTKTSFIMFLGSLLGSYFSIPLKVLLSQLTVAILLTVVSLYSLFTVWRTQKDEGLVAEKKNLFLTLLVGVLLGVLTTLTGLGGGVLLMPIYLGVFKFNSQKAIATSLLTIALASTASLIMQAQQGFQLPTLPDIVLMVLGMILAVFGLKLVTQKIKAHHLALIRKLVFTLVVLLAVSKIF